MSSSSFMAARGAVYSLLLRALSFTLTQITYRIVEPSILGRASIRLELMCNSTILFLGREGFRLSLCKLKITVPKDKMAQSRKVENVAWLCIGWSLFLATLALGFHMASKDAQRSSDYKVGGILFIIATLIEISAEPVVIMCLRQLDLKTRAKAEAIATIAKAFSSVILLSTFPLEKHTMTFGISQCIYALFLSTTLYKEKWNTIIWPTFDVKQGFKNNFDVSAMWLSFIFTGQSFMKLLLTEGDRIVLTAYSDAYDAGIYSMVSSYGGMLSRIIFQPLEENGRLLFSKEHSEIMKQDTSANKERADTLRKMYITLMRLVILIGLLCSTFGSNYTSILLKLLAGSTWGSTRKASDALSAFCHYVAVMSLNGMSEAFVYGVAGSTSEVGRLTIAHALVGVVFYIIAPISMSRNMTKYGGTIGLLIANSICMLLRSVYSVYFASRYFAKHTGSSNETILTMFGGILPNPISVSCFIVAYCVTRTSKIFIYQENIDQEAPNLLSLATGYHLLVGILTFAIWSVSFYHSEKEFLCTLRGMISNKKAGRKGNKVD